MVFARGQMGTSEGFSSPASLAATQDAGNWAGLVADIGGTNARFAYLPGNGANIEQVEALPVAKFATPLHAVNAYLAGVRAALGARYRAPQQATIAVATAVAGDCVRWTNSPWVFSQSDLQAALGLQNLHVLNDFEALALSLPHLQRSQLAWQGLAPQAHEPGGAGWQTGAMLAVVGPGTGLGVAGLKHGTAGWIALAGEGGHATLPAHSTLEVEVLAHLRRKLDHVSAERLLCGEGLQRLHMAICAVHGRPTHERASPTAADIVATGLADLNSTESLSLNAFCAWLGSFCGNVALTLGARGGLYIGGGIVPRLGKRFFQSEFRSRFEAKGRFAPYLATIPTPVIINTEAALLGAAYTLRA